VFANGGYLVQPYFIHKIVDDRGNVLALAEPQRAGNESLRVIDARNAFIMDNIRHRGARGAPRPARHRRQDRHHQRIRRRLVRRLPAFAGGDRLGRL
jgi:membrane carboxypeptidase/penicillin-binding protein